MIQKLRANWRREMLYLGLATMESCWFYPWLTFVLGTGSKAQHIPFVALLSMLLLALYLTRFLTQEAISLFMQRTVTIIIAPLSSMMLLKLYVYTDYSLNDLSWLGSFIWEVGNILQRIPASLIIFFAGLYLWGRGIQLAQRRLDLESVSFSFRVGIIAFLWFFLVRIFGSTVNATSFAFMYFFLGLIVVGLARIEEVNQTHLGIRSPFNASWMAILTGSAFAVIVFSILAANLFSLHNIAALMNQLHPFVVLLGRVAYPLLMVMAWLLNVALTFLIRMFSAAFGAEGQELSPLSRIAEQLTKFQHIEPAQGKLLLILQVIKWGFLGCVFLSALTVLALSINRGLRALQAGRSVEHESVWESERAAKDVQEAIESRWRKLREKLQARLARLRGEEYSLASIRQVYASLVKLATASGFPRHEAETPYEYTITLQRAFPGCEREIKLITEAYVQAHYGQRSFRPIYVQRVREAWLTIRTRQEQPEQQ